jgi:hypothetical protein
VSTDRKARVFYRHRGGVCIERAWDVRVFAMPEPLGFADVKGLLESFGHADVRLLIDQHPEVPMAEPPWAIWKEVAMCWFVGEQMRAAGGKFFPVNGALKAVTQPVLDRLVAGWSAPPERGRMGDDGYGRLLRWHRDRWAVFVQACLEAGLTVSPPAF